MGRPDFEDATAAGDESTETAGDSIGWMQNGQPPGSHDVR